MRTPTSLLLVTALCAMAAPAAAGAPPKGKSEAKQLLNKGRTALKQKRWADAETALRRADELDPSAQTKLDLARALVGEGKLVDASKVLHTIADDPSVKPAAKKAAASAKKELATLEPRIGWLTVVVRGPGLGKASTSVDGQSFDASAELELDPGSHTVSAEADGFDREDKNVTVAEGAHDKLELQLSRSKPEPTPFADTKPAEDKEPKKSSKGSVAPAVVAFGLGAVGLGVGAVFGVMAFNQKSKADDAKAQFQSTGSPQARDDFDSALSTSKTNGTISTVAFIAGGVGVAAGVVLLIARPGRSSTEPKSDEPDKVSVAPWISPSGFGAAGVF